MEPVLLFSIGIPKDRVIEYEQVVKTDGYLVVAHGSADEMARPKAILGSSNPKRIDFSNGRNGLACMTRGRDLKEPVVIRPLPSFPIIRDLVVDRTQFYKQYHSIKPCLVNGEPAPDVERLQPPAERNRLDGAYECILCACRSSQ